MHWRQGSGVRPKNYSKHRQDWKDRSCAVVLCCCCCTLPARHHICQHLPTCETYHQVIGNGVQCVSSSGMICHAMCVQGQPKASHSTHTHTCPHTCLVRCMLPKSTLHRTHTPTYLPCAVHATKKYITKYTHAPSGCMQSTLGATCYAQQANQPIQKTTGMRTGACTMVSGRARTSRAWECTGTLEGQDMRASGGATSRRAGESTLFPR